jgi:hypothetical protein
MGARGPTQFVLTRKGTEELARRTYRLDVRVRNILFLIQKGTPTVEAILQNSIFPREEVVEKLRGLLRDQFVSLEVAGASGSEHPTSPPQPPATRHTATRISTFNTAIGPGKTNASDRPGTIDMSAVPATLDTSIRPGTIGLTSIVLKAAQNGSFAAPSSDYPMLDAGISVSQARFVLCDFCLDQFGMKAQPFIDAINTTADVAGLQDVLDQVTREVRKQRRGNMPALLSRIREINELRT